MPGKTDFIFSNRVSENKRGSDKIRVEDIKNSIS
jgi:hypothetical protein